MRRLRLAGWFLVGVGLALLFILLYEEFSNNLNYYYNHQVNFDLLVLVGLLSFGIGSWLMRREREPKKENPS